MTELPFEYSARPRRQALALPDGARVAFYIAPNIEHFPVGQPAIHLFPATLGCPPDPLNYGWRDYGVRVGLWRVADVLAERGVPMTAAVNSAVCERYPEIVEEGVRAGWTWVCHGRDNATFQAGMDEEEERGFLSEAVDVIERATGARPKGWLGPALTETFNTPRLLAELGFTYVLDWSNDDEPFALTVPGMVAVPYLSELSDITIFHIHGGSAEDFTREVCAHFDRLYAEGTTRPSVMGLGVHPFLIGQPRRIAALEQALDHILGHDDVWITTSDAVADWYQESRKQDSDA
jgi:peptidoglycan/xylan/chitin deacetylase (PgdA/CDA1 family)